MVYLHGKRQSKANEFQSKGKETLTNSRNLVQATISGAPWWLEASETDRGLHVSVHVFIFLPEKMEEAFRNLTAHLLTRWHICL